METGEAVDDPAITFRELPAADDGHLPRHAAADREAIRAPQRAARHPRSGDALAALDDVERAAHDLSEARGRLATSVDRLRAAGFGQQQIDGLLARRVADGATAG